MYVRKQQVAIWKTIGARDLYERGIAVEQIAVDMGMDTEATIRRWLRAARASKAKHEEARKARKAA